MPFNTQPPYSLVQVIDQTADRAFNTIYTNNTGRTLFVDVWIVSQVEALNDKGMVYATVDGVNLTNVGHEANIAFSARTRFYIGFKVMPGITYAINSSEAGTGFVVKGSWIESH